MTKLRSMWSAHAPAAVVIVLAVVAAGACAAAAPQEERPGDAPGRVEGGTTQRIVVDPEPWWPGDADWRDWDGGDAPRIRVWVDRGESATYEPGDRIAIYFRVDRPCHVTVLDYTTDGDVEVLFPSGWTGSGFVRPHEVYRVPDSPRYSLRVTGPSGVETIVAYAHDAAWPDNWFSPWMLMDALGSDAWRSPGSGGPHPPFDTDRGRGPGAVVVEPSRRRGRGPGRVVVEPRWWPVPRGWSERRDRWSSDDTSFYVMDGWPAAPGHWGGDRAFTEQFEMWRCDDEFRREVAGRDGQVEISIRCVDSEAGRPARILGRVTCDDGWDEETLFRLDSDGRRGDLPRIGLSYEATVDGVRVEVEILDLEMSRDRREGDARIEWIRFGVRARGR